MYQLCGHSLNTRGFPIEMHSKDIGVYFSKITTKIVVVTTTLLKCHYKAFSKLFTLYGVNLSPQDVLMTRKQANLQFGCLVSSSLQNLDGLLHKRV